MGRQVLNYARVCFWSAEISEAGEINALLVSTVGYQTFKKVIALMVTVLQSYI
jgi:hypothetical protein